ncbi:MAG: hypothetical protein ABWY93_18835 [Mycobacterium sp.]
MAITSREQLVAASQNASVQHYYRTGMSVPGVLSARASSFSVAGWPMPGSQVSAQTLNSTSVGALWLGDAAAGARWYLTGIAASGQYDNSAMLMDRLSQSAGTALVLSTATAQTINFGLLPARQGTDYSSYGVYLEAYVGTASSLATSAITVSYTNENGVAGRAGTFPGGMPAYGASTGWTIGPMTLQAGDMGVKSIETATVSGGTTGTTAGFVFAKPLAAVNMPYWGGETRLGYADLGLVDLGADPCLYWQVAGNGYGVSSTFTATITCVTG